MEAIGRLANLKSLALFEAPIGDEDLVTLAPLEKLERLCLVGCPKITGSGLTRLEFTRRLKRLSLRASGITDAGIRGLLRFRHLESLDMSETNVGPGVALLRNLPWLERLVLVECQRLRAGHLVPLAALKRIRSIDVSWSGVELTDELREAFKDKPLVFAASGWPM